VLPQQAHGEFANFIVRALTIKKNTEALLVVNKETRLEVNADETKYMVMS